MPSSRRIVAAIVLLVAPLLGAAPAARDHASAHGALRSFDGTSIAYTLFRPATATLESPVPLILHSHGWGGSRSTTGFEEWLDQGFGVLSFDQRGFGDSGGQANVQDPDYEARDTLAVVDFVAGLDWVAHDVGADGQPDPTDPVLGAIGGSYGGGYQWVTALYETETTGRTRFDALAPEIAWFDLSDSLAPSGVVRSEWVTLLYAVGATALPTYVHQAFAYGATTGQWPDGTVPEALVPNLHDEFVEHGPAGFVERGVRLDVPALIRQGNTDTLFNLNQGLHNFSRTLSDDARARSLFVGFNGGHVLPALLPAGLGGDGDPCSDGSPSGGFGQLTRDFFRAAFAERDTAGLLPAPVNLATADGDCLHVAATGIETMTAEGTIGSPSGIGVPQHVPLATGPLTVAGIPEMDATVTSIGVEQRLLVGLSVGTSELDARVIGNQLLPVREALPVVGKVRQGIELPAIAAVVPEGHTLFLTITPVADTYFAHGSLRTPGAVLLDDVAVHLPVPAEAGSGNLCHGLRGQQRAACQRAQRPPVVG